MKGRKPTLVVGISVAQHECVPAIQEVEERSSVEGVAGRTGRGGRHVEVDDDSWFIIDENGDALQFNMWVSRIDSAEIDIDVTERVVDKEEQSASTITSAVATNNGEIIETRITRRRAQLSLLNRCHDYIVFFEKSTEFDRRRPDPIAVKLKEVGHRSGATRPGTRVRVDSAANQKQSEDETTAES